MKKPRRPKLPERLRRDKDGDPGAGDGGGTPFEPPAPESPAAPTAPASGETPPEPQPTEQTFTLGPLDESSEAERPAPAAAEETGPGRVRRMRESLSGRSLPRPRGLPAGAPRLLLAGLAGLALLGAGVGAGYLLFDEGADPVRLPAVAPTVVIEELPEPEAAEQIGFPAFATRNTTRVGGADPIADAAGVALASYPAAGGVEGPKVAVIAPADNWAAALASASLAARPLGAAILLGTEGEIPGFTAEALAGLSPTGVTKADGTQVVAIGGVASPDGLETTTIRGDDPARLAKLIDRQRGRLSGRRNPDAIVVTSATEAGFAMPAAAWAARSGDAIAFADGGDVPQGTLDIIERHPEAAVYVLGPKSVISNKALGKLEKAAGEATRIAGDDPVDNAIEFARYIDGTFGWNINDPGHGFTIANTSRPADAAAAAPLAAGGKPGPLLVTDSADEVPRALRGFLLDTKPGFTDDPARAVYNHIWLMGDTSAISLEFQAQIDQITQLEKVSRGTGAEEFALPSDDLGSTSPPAPGPADR